MKAVQDNNILYNILSPLVQFGTRCHYQSFVVRGLEKLPTDGAYIIAPCHQQALMEPLAVLCFAPKPPVFLARADIFAKPVIRAILTFLKIMPVYRQRDGQGNQSKNYEIFDKSRNVLLDGYPLCLMAEGRHNDRHHLLPMGKGMFRIAGETQEKLGSHPLYIVPTGIDFDEYERPYSNLVVNIGDPIPVQSFMEEYRSNEPVALNAMRQSLAKSLSPLMHDIRHEEYYDQILTLCNILNGQEREMEEVKNNAWNRFRMRQSITRYFDGVLDKGKDLTSFFGMVDEYREKCRRLKLKETQEPNHWCFVCTVAAGLLLAAFAAAVVMVPEVRWTVLFCLLCYPLPLIPTHLLVRRLIKDPQFRSSVNFGIRFLLSIIYAIVIGIVMACTGGAWMSRLADIGAWWGVVAVAYIHVAARLTASAVNGFKATLHNIHYWALRIFRGRKMREMREIWREISK